jgi:type II secretory pathway pseudopilin PulG
MKRRKGTTLVEVLVAVFVMGIGLLSLLTLFPLGAMNMAKSIQDDRAAHVAANAQALAEALDLRNDPNVVAAYDNPDTAQAYVLPNLSTLAGYDGASYPVFLDPLGYFSSAGQQANQQWVGGFASYPPAANNPGFGVARTTANFLNNSPLGAQGGSIRWFTLLDDIKFNTDGTPDQTSGEVEREGAFSFAYLFRRPRRSISSVADMTVVVYNPRVVRLNGSADLREYRFGAVFDTTNNSVTVTWNPAVVAAPQVNAGDWILDATIETNAAGQPKPHGFFYRVTDVDGSVANQLTLQIQTPFKEFPKGQQTAGVVVILEGVAEVFDKGSGWQP